MLILIVILGAATVILAFFPDRPYIEFPLTALLVVVFLWVTNQLRKGGGGNGGSESGGGFLS